MNLVDWSQFWWNVNYLIEFNGGFVKNHRKSMKTERFSEHNIFFKLRIPIFHKILIKIGFIYQTIREYVGFRKANLPKKRLITRFNDFQKNSLKEILRNVMIDFHHFFWKWFKGPHLPIFYYFFLKLLNLESFPQF